MRVKRHKPPPPAFVPVTITLETPAELYLMLGLLTLNRDIETGQIASNSDTFSNHRKIMTRSIGADDIAMYRELAKALTRKESKL